MVLIVKGQEFLFNVREREEEREKRNDSRAYK
jgi:hypothetical protein